MFGGNNSCWPILLLLFCCGGNGFGCGCECEHGNGNGGFCGLNSDVLLWLLALSALTNGCGCPHRCD